MVQGAGDVHDGDGGRTAAAQGERDGDRLEAGDDLVVAGGVAALRGLCHRGAQLLGRVGGPLLRRQQREDGLAGGAHRDRVAGAGALRHGGDGVPRLDADERHALVVVEDGEEAGHAQLVGDRGELRQRLGLQVVGDARRERGHARAQRDPAVRVAHHQPVVLQRAQQAVGDGPVHLERPGDVVDAQGCAGVGEHLQDADAAAECLRRRGAGVGHRGPSGGLPCIQ